MNRQKLFKTMVICLALLTAPTIASAAQVAPTNLQETETQVADVGAVTLTWTAAKGAAGYNVYRDNQYLATVTNPPYTDYLDGKYTYYITAFDSSRQQFSGRSNEITVVAAPFPFVPDDPVDPKLDIVAPEGLSVQENSESEVILSWLPVAGAAGYNVYRNEAYFGTVMANEEFTDKNPLEGSNEYYVTAFDASKKHFSAKSNKVIHVSGSDPVDVNPPTDNQALVDSESRSIPDANINGYNLVFSDEFNGSTLNPQRWNTQLRWDGEYNGERYEYRLINGEQQFYVNLYSKDQEHLNTIVPKHNPFKFNGNRLAIRVVRNPLKTSNGNKNFGPLREMVAQQPFLSGAISTFDKFSQKYGYFEARIKIPGHIGAFPAFWLHHQKKNNEGTHRTEIDIMENLGHAPWYIYNSFHYNGGSPKPQPEGQIFTGTNYHEDYHVYAVEWEPGHITWFIDGEIVSELVNENVNYEKLYLIINLAMGGNWSDSPTNAGGFGRHFPTEEDLKPENFHNPALEIDYVRIYKRK